MEKPGHGFEQCEHPACDYYSRADYCYKIATDNQGPINSVIELADNLLVSYYGTLLSCRSMSAQLDAKESFFSRRFTYCDEDDRGEADGLIENVVKLEFRADRRLRMHSYMMELSWKPVFSLHDGVYARRFTIDQYETGPFQAIVEEPYLTPEMTEPKPVSRPITSYDVRDLHQELQLLHATLYADSQRLQ